MGGIHRTHIKYPPGLPQKQNRKLQSHSSEGPRVGQAREAAGVREVREQAAGLEPPSPKSCSHLNPV